jgi:hypothetical protein
MATKTQRVLVLHPGCDALPLVISDDFQSFRALVGGGFSVSQLTHDIGVYYHDEGLLIGLTPNRMTQTGVPLYGTLVFAGVDEDGESRDLTAEEIAFVQNEVSKWKSLGSFEHTFPDTIIASTVEELRAKQAARDNTYTSEWIGANANH